MDHMPIVARKSINGLILGEIRAFPFRQAELFKYGWYYANGDKYDLTSDPGQVLNSFDSQYKSDMGISVSNNKINVPKLIYTDGRHYFIRGGATPGVVQNDAIRNIVGKSKIRADGAKIDQDTGPFTSWVNNSNQAFTGANNSSWDFLSTDFDASRCVPVANENRPLNFTMVFAIYLGV
jgi:hypothetical protein